ncbi:hypothetical protein FC778_13090 [Clostridium botulinum]|nr:hypothetical protein [Clostridium botulinum]
MTNEQKNNSLKKFLIDISNDVSLDNVEKYVNMLNNIYDKDFRHEYSTITGVLFLIADIEARDMLPEKIKYIEEGITDKKLTVKIDKLWDHINLENIRLAELKKVSIEANRAVKSVQKKYIKLQQEYSETQEKWEKINTSALQAKDNLEQVEKKINDSTTQSITILGIFSGIVMAFTGGLSFVASALQNINSISKYRLIFIILLLSGAIFNIIFMLIYVIAKLNRTYIGSKCNCDCQFEGCSEKTLDCSVVRYPIVIWVNIVLIISLFGTFILYIIDKFNILTRLLSINHTFSVVIIVLLSLTLLIALILMILGIIKLTKIECKYELNESIFKRMGKVFSNSYVKKKK